MTETERKNIHHFILLFIGQTISQLGSAMTAFAVVIWAYSTSGKAMSSSLLAICSTLPYLIVSLFGGAAADNANKKKIMLICDLIAAVGSGAILVSSLLNGLHLWLLCLVNMVSGFMNAFQNPASQVAVTLLIPREYYARISGIQSAVNGAVNILKPILAAAFLSVGGLNLVLIIDLGTFFFAFTTLLFFVKIPDNMETRLHTSFAVLWASLKDGVAWIKKERAILLLLILYSVLEFMGAISADGMASAFLLARTGNNEGVVGIVSAFMAAGCFASSLMLTVMKAPAKKLGWMFFGSYMCFVGIALLGMGQSIVWWCIAVFIGCFGSPIYQTCQTVLIREKVDVSMQGRIFSLQGMATGMLVPIGFFLGALLSDSVFEPFMSKSGSVQNILQIFVGAGKGSGIGLIFVIAGTLGIIILTAFLPNKTIRTLEQ